MNRVVCTILAFLAAAVAAPATLAVVLSLVDWFRSGTIDVGSMAVVTLFFAIFGTPVSLVIGLVFGVPFIVLARALEARGALFYAAGGLFAGICAALFENMRTNGSEPIGELAITVVAGIVSALTFWALSEREPSGCNSSIF